MIVAVSLPEELALLTKKEGQGLDRAVTVALVFYHYEHGILSAGKAAQLLGLGRSEFEQLRSDQGIDRPFNSEELRRDMNWTPPH